VVSALALVACDEQTTAPSTAAPTVTTQRVKSEWRDDSPHREGHVRTRSATLHYLDWGGKGPTLVLLAGLGDNAHIYDDLAPKLTSRYHVIAITRRGYGQSSRPTGGYAVDSLVADDIAVLDHLKLDRVYLAGHSVAGNELTRLAVKYPSRVERLVYIDAAADRTQGLAGRSAGDTTQYDVLQEPPPEEGDLVSFAAFVEYQKSVTRSPWTPAFENNLWYALTVDRRDGRVVAFSTDESIQALMAAESYRYRPEFSSLTMPALAIGALPGTIFDALPWLPPTVSGDSLATAEWFIGFYQNQIRSNVAGFAAEAPFAETRFVENTTHYVFIRTESEILAALRNFLPN
jgi:pimeloyl-ACP methyl ester carboxylesterase